MIRQYWWKILGVVLFLFVLIIGLVTPLKPGILEVSQLTAKSGTSLELTIKTYNTQFLKANKLRAWLKIDSVHLIAANHLNAISDNLLNTKFEIPTFLPNNRESQSVDLILDSNIDGYAILPNAMFISQVGDKLNVVEGRKQWTTSKIDRITPHSGFSFPYRNILNETSRNLFFHVAIWFAMFILLIIALYYSIQYLRTSQMIHDIYASSLTSVAIIFGLAGLVTGSIWAKFTWGQFWINDVKLNMSVVALLIYFAYWILRSSIKDQDQRAKISAVYSIFAFAALIPLVFVIPRITDSMHPGNGGNPAFSEDDLDNTMRIVFYPAIIGLTLIGMWIASLAIRYKQLKEIYFLKRMKTQ